jgi:hypothetical protein
MDYVYFPPTLGKTPLVGKKAFKETTLMRKFVFGLTLASFWCPFLTIVDP